MSVNKTQRHRVFLSYRRTDDIDSIKPNEKARFTMEDVWANAHVQTEGKDRCRLDDNNTNIKLDFKTF